MRAELGDTKTEPAIDRPTTSRGATTNILEITIMFHANYFRTAAIDSLCDTAIAATLTAARWGVIGWEWYTESFFSAKAKARYEWVGQILGCAIALMYFYAQHWVDAQVSASLPAEVDPVAAEMTVDPFCPEVNPLPVVVAPAPALDDEAKKLEVSRLESLTIRQLKAAAKGKVPGYGRMTKAQLVQALAG